MARVLTNNTGISFAKEASLGVLPGSPVWRQLEPNSIGDYGANLSKIVRNPISKNRQRRKGAITDLGSTVSWQEDWTGDSFINFADGFAFSVFKGTAPFSPTAVTGTGYTVASGGALPDNTLVYARGFVNSANNGLKLLAGTSTGTSIKTTGLVAEASAPTNALVEVAGRRGASGDLTIDASGNLNSTVLDFTTLGLTVGQSIWIGGDLTANSFANAANRGYARIIAIAATKLTLDKRSQTFVTDTGTGKLIDILFGRFLRNVPVDHADYATISYQFEALWANLQNPGPGDMYEYAKGNLANEITLNLPLTDKATVEFGFIGTDTPVPTTVRATNAAAALLPVRTAPLNTSSDIARLRIAKLDETGITTDFKELSLKISNNVNPEKVIGTLGAKYMNTGNFEVDIDATVLFTDAEVVTAIRNNTTVGMDFAVRNSEGAVLVDIPAMILEGGDKSLPVNESVQLKTTANAFADPTLNTSIGVSLFPYVPAS